MEHIETIELTASQSSITFSSIPQDYDDLIVLYCVRSSSFLGTNQDDINLKINTIDTTPVVLFGTGSGVGTGNFPNEAGYAAGSNTTANTFSNNSLYIMNYKSSSNKSVSVDSVYENNGTNVILAIKSNNYAVTSAVTTLEFFLSQGDIVSGSTFSLYGITAGGSGTVTTS